MVSLQFKSESFYYGNMLHLGYFSTLYVEGIDARKDTTYVVIKNLCWIAITTNRTCIVKITVLDYIFTTVTFVSLNYQMLALMLINIERLLVILLNIKLHKSILCKEELDMPLV